MKEIWRLARPVTAGEMTSRLAPARGWKPQTVSTFLVRLVEKELLNREKREGQNYYAPAVSEEDYRADQTRRFVAEMHGGSVRSLIASLYDDRGISDEELSALKKWLEGRPQE